MASVPYPLTAEDLEGLRTQVYETIRQIYEEKVGGADLGDVFSVPGDVLTLVLGDSSGLTKTGNELAVEISSTGAIQVGTGGLEVKLNGTSLTKTVNGLSVTTPVSGSDTDFTVITSLEAGGGGAIGIQYKTRALTLGNGLITAVGDESAWVAI